MTFTATFRVSVRAFSLIEVVLAMSVVAFSLLAIIGMLPIGLQTMRDSQNDQAQGTIANQLRGDLQQIQFGTGTGTLGALSGTTYYYTAEGLKTDINNTSGQAYYQAQFAVANAGVNGNVFSSAAGAPSNAAIVTVTLLYPYPSTAETNIFSLFATEQTGQVAAP